LALINRPDHPWRPLFDQRREWAFALLLALGVIAAFWPALNNGFISYDDTLYITENQAVRSGLSRASFIWAWTTTHTGNWIPLTWLSLMLDSEIFGLNPGGFHLTNLLLHLANSLILFLVLKRMTGASGRSALVAALFALHPLHVESVAWAAERKDVLSAFFWMLTLLAYFHYVQRPGVVRYILVFLFLAAGLLAKPMLVTLPFVLLLLDYWPLNRLRPTSSGQAVSLIPAETRGIRPPEATLKGLVLEKLPLLALVGFLSLAAFKAQSAGGTMADVETLSLPIRAANAAMAYVAYLGKMVWPVKLAVFYPHPKENISCVAAITAGLFLLLMTIAAVWPGRRRRYLPVGWLWYLGTLIPVIGLVQVGRQAMADRYTYLPLIGVFILIAWGAAELTSSWKRQKIVLTILSLIILFTLAAVTHWQAGYWKNSRTLFERALAVTSNNDIMHYNLGVILTEQGRFDEALRHYREALRIRPGYAKVHNNLGSILALRGRSKEAAEHFAKAIQNAPDDPTGYVNLGGLSALDGDIEGAMKSFRKALTLDPNFAEAHNYLGMALASRGRLKEAVHHFARAVEIAPQYELAQANLNRAREILRKTNQGSP